MKYKINWGQLLECIMYLIVFGFSVSYVSDTYMSSSNLKSIFFGVMLLFLFLGFLLPKLYHLKIAEKKDEFA